jgi:hypothetical protein
MCKKSVFDFVFLVILEKKIKYIAPQHNADKATSVVNYGHEVVLHYVSYEVVERCAVVKRL